MYDRIIIITRGPFAIFLAISRYCSTNIILDNIEKDIRRVFSYFCLPVIASVG